MPDAAGAASPLPRARPVHTQPSTPRQRAERRVEEELKKLAAAHAGGILSLEEYTAKKATVAARTDEYEVQLIVDERAAKLKEALNAGIFDQAEYDTKVANLPKLARESIQKERSQTAKAGQLAKLKAAMDAGILTEEEYEAKVKSMETV